MYGSGQVGTGQIGRRSRVNRRVDEERSSQHSTGEGEREGGSAYQNSRVLVDSQLLHAPLLLLTLLAHVHVVSVEDLFGWCMHDWCMIGAWMLIE